MDIIAFMRVPFEWLKEFVNIAVNADEVAHRLTMIGLEVEGKENVSGDIVFEVNVTPNRPDCLSIFGIAREISATMNVPLKLPEFMVKEEMVKSDLNIEISDPELCHRYAGRTIRDVKISESPKWLKDRLEKCGLRSINNVVDVTNYVLLELGHPLHAFDLDKLAGNKIVVKIAGEGSKITTLDAVERKLPNDALLIWDAKNPVAIAGIMGGADTEVSGSTKNIFLESAYFNPASVRRTSKGMGLSTEASYRFEREADVDFLIRALDRTAYLIQKIAGGKVYKKTDVYAKRYVPPFITVKYDKVNRSLGTNISNEDMIGIIKRLNVDVTKGRDSFSVSPPAFRLDMKRDVDIIEEIARIYGYDKIKSALPKAVISEGISDPKHFFLKKIKDVVRKKGFNEAINYSFMNEASLGMLGIPAVDKRQKLVPIRNPLRKEEAFLRTTIVPSLIDNFMRNFSRGVKDIRIFEAGRIFEDSGKTLPNESARLGGVFYKDKTPSLWKDNVHGFYFVKGVVEAILDDLRIKEYKFSLSKEPFLHPGQSCDINVSGLNIGFIGALSPVVVEKLNLKVTKPEIIMFEIDVDKLFSFVPLSFQYSQIPKFPYVERDIAIIVSEKIVSAEVIDIVRSYNSDLVEDVSVFDVYKGGNVPEGKKSLAFTIRYRADDRTLTELEVESLHQNIVRHLISKTGGALRS